MKRPKRMRRYLWVGSIDSYYGTLENLFKSCRVPSWTRHAPPFAKRLEGAARRQERRFKYQQRSIPCDQT